MTDPPGSGSYAAAWDRLIGEAGLDLQARTIDVAGTSTRMWSWGRGDDLLLVHGAGTTAASWLGLLPHLAGRRVHLPDLPGFGFGAPFAWDRGDIRRHAAAIIDGFLDAASPAEDAALVGNSLGGWLVLAWALAQKDPPPRVSVVGLTAGLQAGPVPPRTALRALEAHGITSGEVHDELSSRAGPPARLHPDPGVVSDGQRAIGVALWDSPVARESWAGVLRAMLTPQGTMSPALDLRDDLRRSGLTFTYAFGTEDPYLGVLDPRGAPAPGAEAIAVPGAGHLPWFERPRAIARILTA